MKPCWRHLKAKSKTPKWLQKCLQTFASIHAMHHAPHTIGTRSIIYDCWCLPVDRFYRYSFAPAKQSQNYRMSPCRDASYSYLEIVWTTWPSFLIVPARGASEALLGACTPSSVRSSQTRPCIKQWRGLLRVSKALRSVQQPQLLFKITNTLSHGFTYSEAHTHDQPLSRECIRMYTHVACIFTRICIIIFETHVLHVCAGASVWARLCDTRLHLHAVRGCARACGEVYVHAWVCMCVQRRAQACGYIITRPTTFSG